MLLLIADRSTTVVLSFRLFFQARTGNRREAACGEEPYSSCLPPPGLAPLLPERRLLQVPALCKLMVVGDVACDAVVWCGWRRCWCCDGLCGGRSCCLHLLMQATKKLHRQKSSPRPTSLLRRHHAAAAAAAAIDCVGAPAAAGRAGVLHLTMVLPLCSVRTPTMTARTAGHRRQIQSGGRHVCCALPSWFQCRSLWICNRLNQYNATSLGTFAVAAVRACPVQMWCV